MDNLSTQEVAQKPREINLLEDLTAAWVDEVIAALTTEEPNRGWLQSKFGGPSRGEPGQPQGLMLFNRKESGEFGNRLMASREDFGVRPTLMISVDGDKSLIQDLITGIERLVFDYKDPENPYVNFIYNDGHEFALYRNGGMYLKSPESQQ